MTPAQLRAARALLDWTQGDLAARSGVSEVTIRNFEKGKTQLQPATARVLRSTIEAAGIVFTDNDGVCRRKGE